MRSRWASVSEACETLRASSSARYAGEVTAAGGATVTSCGVVRTSNRQVPAPGSCALGACGGRVSVELTLVSHPETASEAARRIAAYRSVRMVLVPRLEVERVHDAGGEHRRLAGVASADRAAA